MKSLSETWFAEGYIDFELKKYTLLAYLQQVNKYFNENKLYPQLRCDIPLQQPGSIQRK